MIKKITDLYEKVKEAISDAFTTIGCLSPFLLIGGFLLHAVLSSFISDQWCIITISSLVFVLFLCLFVSNLSYKEPPKTSRSSGTINPHLTGSTGYELPGREDD